MDTRICANEPTLTLCQQSPTSAWLAETVVSSFRIDGRPVNETPGMERGLVEDPNFLISGVFAVCSES